MARRGERLCTTSTGDGEQRLRVGLGGQLSGLNRCRGRVRGLDIPVTAGNHSIHYHPSLLEAVPEHTHSVLDIGCGEGMFTRKLSESIPTVVGVDTDQASIDPARKHAHDIDAKYIVRDFPNYPFEDQSFDVIAAVATLHHMDDPRAALSRIRTLLQESSQRVDHLNFSPKCVICTGAMNSACGGGVHGGVGDDP